MRKERVFGVLESFQKKQKCSMRHTEPRFIKVSKKNSKTLFLHLKTLLEIATPIRADLLRQQTEKEILSGVVSKVRSENNRSKEYAENGDSKKKSLRTKVRDTVSSSSASSQQDIRPPKPFDID